MDNFPIVTVVTPISMMVYTAGNYTRVSTGVYQVNFKITATNVEPFIQCDTGTSGQRRSNGNIELVRFLDSHEGDGARAVFAGVQLLYKNNFPNDPPSKFAHR